MLLAKKTWSNAAAFISINEETKAVTVYGKFYDDSGRGYEGPSTDVLDTISEDLLQKAQKAIKGRVCWGDEIPMSSELKQYCNNIWKMAKEVEPWFKY